jgi:hypothetical protein
LETQGVSRFQSFKVSKFHKNLGTRAVCPDNLLAHVAEFAGMSFLGQGWMNMEELWKTNATSTGRTRSRLFHITAGDRRF